MFSTISRTFLANNDNVIIKEETWGLDKQEISFLMPFIDYTNVIVKTITQLLDNVIFILHIFVETGFQNFHNQVM
jgi:hypothetical protein